MSSEVKFFFPADEYAECEAKEAEELYGFDEKCSGGIWVVEVNGVEETTVCEAHKEWAREEYGT